MASLQPVVPFRRIDAPIHSGQPRRYALGPPLVDKAVELVSVTSVLTALPKPALKAWGENVVARAAVEAYQSGILAQMSDEEEIYDWLRQAPFRTMSRAGRRGTSIHDIAESVLTGRIEPGDNVWAKHVLDFADRWIAELICVEQTCVNLKHGWAGTTDLIYRDHGGDVVLADWKSAKDVYPDNALQLAAYANAEKWIMNPHASVPTLADPVHIDRLAILHVTDEGIEYWEPDTNIPKLYKQFRAVQSVWESLRGEGKIRMTQLMDPPMKLETALAASLEQRGVKPGAPAKVRPTVEEYVEHLRARCIHAQSEKVEFKDMLRAAWPQSVPTLASGDVSTIRQCEAIERVVTQVERQLDITFGAVPHLVKADAS